MIFFVLFLSIFNIILIQNSTSKHLDLDKSTKILEEVTDYENYINDLFYREQLIKENNKYKIEQEKINHEKQELEAKIAEYKKQNEEITKKLEYIKKQ